MPSIDFVKKHLPKAEPKVSTSKNGTIANTPNIGYSDFEKASICANDAATRGINLVEEYPEWWLALASLASLGEPARELAHLVSSQSSKYNYEECDKKFNEALKNSSITGIDYFLKRCQEAGITYHRPNLQKKSLPPTEEKTDPKESEMSFSELLKLKYDDANPVPKPIPVITIDDCIISTAGNITVIGGASKVGKSGVVGAILAGSMRRKGDAIPIENLLGITTAANTEFKGIIHADTEQSRYDHHRTNKQALKRCNREIAPDYYYSFSLQKFTPNELKNACKLIFESVAKKHNGLHLAVIDGIGDFVGSVNDEVEGNEVINTMIQLSTEYNIPIVVVLHLNPNSEKMRGHIGSQLERKCESFISIAKENEASVIKGKLLRNAGSFNEIIFEFDREKGFHTMKDRINKEELTKQRKQGVKAKKIEEYTSILDDVFGESEKVRRKEIIHGLMDYFSIKVGGAEKRFIEAIDLDLIQKEGTFYKRKQ